MDEHRISRVLFEDQSLGEGGDGADNGDDQESQRGFVQSSTRQTLKKEPAEQVAPQKPNQKADQKPGAHTGKDKPEAGPEKIDK